MTRGLGAIPALQDLLPDVVLSALVAATALGSVAVLLSVVAAIYWFRDRRAGAFGLACLLGALSLTVGLKALFALPRPPAATWLAPADGFGFPSGHAIAATVAWGAIALELDWSSRRRRRLAVAAVVVGIVALSRVAIGVHYAVDVVAGVAVGLAFLALVHGVAAGDPARAFPVALAAAVLGVLASGGTADAVVLFAGTAAGLATWRTLEPPPTAWGREGVLPALGGGALVGVALLLHDGGLAPLPISIVAVAAAVAVTIGLPAAVEATAHRWA